MVALDADTGKLKWHFQFSPHDEFDYDAVQIPVLADATWQGKPRKLMYFANRNGYFYVLDRATGEFLSGKPFVEVNWASGLDAKRAADSRRRQGAERASGHVDLPGKSGGHQLVFAVVQPPHRTCSTFRRGRTTAACTCGTKSNTSRGAASPAAGRARRCLAFERAGGSAGRSGDEGYGAVRAIDPNTGALKLGIQDERSHVGGDPDDGVERAVQRRQRRIFLRARCADGQLCCGRRSSVR